MADQDGLRFLFDITDKLTPKLAKIVAPSKAAAQKINSAFTKASNAQEIHLAKLAALEQRRVAAFEVGQGEGKKLISLAAHLSHGEALPDETWIASLCEKYHKLPSEIIRELEGDTAELFRDVLISDHFMEGWEARREAMRERDAKAKQRILKDHRVSIELVERVMAELLDDSQTHEDGL